MLLAYFRSVSQRAMAHWGHNIKSNKNVMNCVDCGYIKIYKLKEWGVVYGYVMSGGYFFATSTRCVKVSVCMVPLHKQAKSNK